MGTLQAIARLSLTEVVTIAVEATLALLVLIWWLWWWLPRRQVTGLAAQIPDPKARADVEDNFRKTAGQALGGAAVLIGAVVAYLQFTQQQQASRDLLISNQVSKGFEQLAGKETALRLGGIYGLEGVMNNSPEYHEPVLEVLCAFVRDSTIGKTMTDGTAIDVQAALTVIGRRRLDGGSGDLDLARANIPKAHLGGANLMGANLTRAILIEADLTGGADLSGAELRGAKLRGAHLNGVDLRGAHLNEADLTGADLRGAFLNFADLTDANLTGANLTGANLTGALVDVEPSDADLTYAALREAMNRSHVQVDRACGAGVTLPGGNLSDLKPCPRM